MAILRRRLHRFNGTSYDVVHFETEASLVKMADGITLENKINTMNSAISGKANSSHNHSAANITSGTLSVSRGGTGVTSMDALKSALGIGGGSGAIPSAPVSIGSVGTTLTWANYTWRVVHKINGIAILALNSILKNCIFGYDNGYAGSNLETECRIFEASNGISLCDYVLPWRCGKVFVASYAEINGGFSYFNDNNSRACDNQVYWTSSPRSGGYVFYVYTGGGLGGYNPNSTYGFRPCVALKI